MRTSQHSASAEKSSPPPKERFPAADTYPLPTPRSWLMGPDGTSTRDMTRREAVDLPFE